MEPCVLKLKRTDRISDNKTKAGKAAYNYLNELDDIMQRNYVDTWKELITRRLDLLIPINEAITNDVKKSGHYDTHKFEGIELKTVDVACEVTSLDTTNKRMTVDVKLVSDEITIINEMPDKSLMYAVGNKTSEVQSGEEVKGVNYFYLNNHNIYSQILINRCP